MILSGTHTGRTTETNVLAKTKNYKTVPHPHSCVWGGQDARTPACNTVLLLASAPPTVLQLFSLRHSALETNCKKEHSCHGHKTFQKEIRLDASSTRPAKL